MPIYEYTCRACGAAFEHWHASMSEAAPPCPECGGEVKRRISVPAARTGGTESAGRGVDRERGRKALPVGDGRVRTQGTERKSGCQRDEDRLIVV